ncbi:DUF2637 domain-containing protein [Streptomyces liangshanensis]|uniref:DUF2637 domain-containing protein n=1 Tax=Streptomyces liangshanensis TaxID=2717324 RepID=UPI0036D9DFE2
MTTTIIAPRTAVPDAPPEAETPAPGAAVEVEAEAGIEEARSSAGRAHRGLMISVGVVGVLAGLAAAGVGFALSYGALVEAAASWGFGEGWQRHVFPVGVDGLIIALYCVDLVLAWRGMARAWVRLAAHVVTAVTIGLNMAAAAGSAPGSPGLLDALAEHPARLASHAAMPIAYVLLTEAARWAIVRTAQLEAGGLDHGRLTLADWLLRFPTTWAIFRHAQTWPATYAEARLHVRELAIHRVWLKHRREIEQGLSDGWVGVLDQMPDLLARYGVGVEEARAIPDRMRARERKRQEDRDRDERDRERQEERQAREDERERVRQARDDEHAERLARLEAEAEETRRQGELAILQARTTGAVKAAEAESAASADTASIHADAARSAAERAATEAQRLADAEERAEETARTGVLRRQAEEENLRAARLAEERAEAEERAAELERAAAVKRAEAEQRSADAVKAIAHKAEYEERIEASKLRVAQDRKLRAEIELRAQADEEDARLTPRERNIRKVARLIIGTAAGLQDQHSSAELASMVSLSAVSSMCRVSETTAGDYRKEAVDLIRQGYNPQ